MKDKISEIETQQLLLNDFDPEVRADALMSLVHLAETGQIPLEPEKEVANMHCHTFFSYNGYGYSPSALAWLAKKQGYKLMGIVDFDVLDGVEEFLNACDLVGVRGSAGLETRVFIPEFASREINSPGEPGIFYYMGIGFVSTDAMDRNGTKATAILKSMRERAGQRNRGVIKQVNAYLDPVRLDYDCDVLLLTPAGNATERHICAAYVNLARDTVTDLAGFWADKLKVAREQIITILDDGPKIQDLVRSKLMKRGGVGYVQPSPDTFPSVEEVNTVIIAAGALPCATWLDGTSAGEQAIEELLDLLIGKGIVALNIIPDRNWNIADPETKARKVANLYKVVELAQRLDLPLNVGTEMNKYGLKLVDDFDVPELEPVREAFLDGAYFIYGHTVLQRTLRLGYQSDWAKFHFPARRERNEFYTQIGRKVAPGQAILKQLQQLSSVMQPSTILSTIGEFTVSAEKPDL
ncbi:MAG: hypothetical protein JXA33_01040 [Anaerolineae bacterium]|nr:hypothetical protein [Anaerolineae bacterium]